MSSSKRRKAHLQQLAKARAREARRNAPIAIYVTLTNAKRGCMGTIGPYATFEFLRGRVEQWMRQTWQQRHVQDTCFNMFLDAASRARKAFESTPIDETPAAEAMAEDKFNAITVMVMQA